MIIKSSVHTFIVMFLFVVKQWTIIFEAEQQMKWLWVKIVFVIFSENFNVSLDIGSVVECMEEEDTDGDGSMFFWFSSICLLCFLFIYNDIWIIDYSRKLVIQ